MSDSEWFGEPHTLTVHAVDVPESHFDNGDLHYDLEHPPSCRQEERRCWDLASGGALLLEWTCDVAEHERESGLSYSLRYSGTPITEPGTYRVQSWGRKTYYHEYGAYEYDGGVGVMGPDEARTGGAS